MSPQRIGVTFQHGDLFYRGMTNAQSDLGQAAARGILQVGKHWTIAGFKHQLRAGRLQLISKEQAMRLTPEAITSGAKRQPQRSGKVRAKSVLLYLDEATLLKVKALAKQQGTYVSRLIREWVRTGLALALDHMNSFR